MRTSRPKCNVILLDFDLEKRGREKREREKREEKRKKEERGEIEKRTRKRTGDLPL